MPVKCKYNNGRVLNIDYFDLDGGRIVNTDQRYNILLIEKGRLNCLKNGSNLCFTAPCVVALRENTEFEIKSSHMLLARCIAFNVSFLNVNITFDLINSGRYQQLCDEFSFVPLNIFYENNESYFGSLPLLSEDQFQLREHFVKFEQSVTTQQDARWSCRARLHLNAILEHISQLYFDYLSGGIPVYNIKEPNVWVSLMLKKIHADYAKKISLITLALDIHINKTTVSQCFRNITGYSVTDYIINYRIKCACYSLATTDITISEIASECGFQSATYFIRQFKARMGLAPGEYRIKCLRERKNSFG